MSADILVVDDESDIRYSVGGILEDEGYEVRLAATADQAFSLVSQRKPSLAILDIWLQGSPIDGLGVLDRLKETHADLPIVMFSGHGTIETAVRAIHRGAYDYIEKPFKADRLLLVVARALEACRLKRENVELREKAGYEDDLIGHSPIMRQIKMTLKKVAPTNSRILISGPVGSGKETAARFVHEHSARAEGPFMSFSAAMFPAHSVESFFFGGGKTAEGFLRTGALEQAHGGTLFLDEIADFPLQAQAKLVRFLTDQTFERLGENQKINVDVRIISSTSRCLEQGIGEGSFREDLYHRLSVVPIFMPSLQERLDDMFDLVDFFSKKYALFSGQATRCISDEVIEILKTRQWPGHIRQLKNYVERLLILTEPSVEEIRSIHLPSDRDVSPDSFTVEEFISLPLREARETFEKRYLLSQLGRFGHNISKTAQFVGMERSALHRKLKSLGVSTGEEGGVKNT